MKRFLASFLSTAIAMSTQVNAASIGLGNIRDLDRAESGGGLDLDRVSDSRGEPSLKLPGSSDMGRQNNAPLDLGAVKEKILDGKTEGFSELFQNKSGTFHYFGRSQNLSNEVKDKINTYADKLLSDPKSSSKDKLMGAELKAAVNDPKSFVHLEVGKDGTVSIQKTLSSDVVKQSAGTSKSGQQLYTNVAVPMLSPAAARYMGVAPGNTEVRKAMAGAVTGGDGAYLARAFNAVEGKTMGTLLQAGMKGSDIKNIALGGGSPGSVTPVQQMNNLMTAIPIIADLAKSGAAMTPALSNAVTTLIKSGVSNTDLIKVIAPVMAQSSASQIPALTKAATELKNSSPEQVAAISAVVATLPANLQSTFIVALSGVPASRIDSFVNTLKTTDKKEAFLAGYAAAGNMVKQQFVETFNAVPNDQKEAFVTAMQSTPKGMDQSNLLNAVKNTGAETGSFLSLYNSQPADTKAAFVDTVSRLGADSGSFMAIVKETPAANRSAVVTMISASLTQMTGSYDQIKTMAKADIGQIAQIFNTVTAGGKNTSQSSVILINFGALFNASKNGTNGLSVLAKVFEAVPADKKQAFANKIGSLPTERLLGMAAVLGRVLSAPTETKNIQLPGHINFILETKPEDLKY